MRPIPTVPSMCSSNLNGKAGWPSIETACAAHSSLYNEIIKYRPNESLLVVTKLPEVEFLHLRPINCVPSRGVFVVILVINARLLYN